MLKILQARLQQYVNQELLDVQARFRKGRGTRNQITNIHWIIKQGNSRKTSTSASLTMLKPLTEWIRINCGKLLKRWEHQTTLPVSWKNLNAGQEATVRTLYGTTDWFKIGKGVPQGCIFSPCLTYMQNTSCEIWARGITSWNQDCWEKKSTISDM